MRTASLKMAEAGAVGKPCDSDCFARGTELRCGQFLPNICNPREAFMRVIKRMQLGLMLVLAFCWAASAQHIGKYVPIPAGSDADHAMQAINAATDPAQKLSLIDKFAAELGTADMAIVADEMYVNYYLGQKNYPKAFEYGDKLFAADPDNLQSAVNIVQAASQAGDTDKLLAYAEKASGI